MQGPGWYFFLYIPYPKYYNQGPLFFPLSNWKDVSFSINDEGHL